MNKNDMRRLMDAPAGMRPSVMNNIVNRHMKAMRRDAKRFGWGGPRRRDITNAVRIDWLRYYGVAVV